jgi:hypothetical protein
MTRYATILLAAVLSWSVGCGSDKAGAFKAEQAHTVTPHGRIDQDSVEETAEGRIRYRTSDGMQWSVEMERAADGKYRYGDAQLLEE